MTTRKRNEWLDTEPSDEEENGYDSEAAEESRFSRKTKRRRISLDENNSDESHDESADEQGDSKSPEPGHNTIFKNVENDENSTVSAAKNRDRDRKKTTLKPEKLLKSGVIYLSRIPPYMKPATVKSLLSAYGTVSRIFLTPEDSTKHTARVRAGGNKKRSFVDGWVEFTRKRDAKLVAETLNAQIVGGKKGGWYHDDVWNIKYLRGFKWHHLTDQIANENAERAARMRAEISASRREDKRFVANVEKAKMLEGMAKKRAEKEDRGGVANGQTIKPQTFQTTGSQSNTEDNKVHDRNRKLQFRQNEVKTKRLKDSGSTKQPEEVTRVLNKIF